MSILTLEEPSKPEDFDDTASESIIDLCLKNNLSELFLVDDNMSGLITAEKNAVKKNLKFRFGIKLICCENLEDKSNDSLNTQHKIIIFAKNPLGYEKITELYSKAATDGLYYKPRIDCKFLKEKWDNSIALVIPFYSSFLHKNLLYGFNCIPDFDRINPIFLQEDNQLPFDYLLNDSLDKFLGKNPRKIPSKSIYYHKRSDFKKYITNRCIHERTYLNMPNIDHLGSSEFCLESWLENERL